MIKKSFRINVASIRIEFCFLFAESQFIVQLLDQYNGFLTSSSPEYKINFVLYPGIVSKKRKIVVQSNGTGYYIQRYDFVAYLNRLNKQAIVFSFPGKYSFNSFLRIFYSIVLLENNGFLLHSSGVVRNNKSILFSAPSNQGKTTMARLFPAKNLLSDELVAVRKTKDNFMAYRTPFSGELNSEYSKQLKGEIESIYFLRRSSKNEEIKLTVADAWKKLLRNVFWFSETVSDNDKLSMILMNVTKHANIYKIGLGEAINKFKN